MIVVNPSTRQFNVPGADLVFGVTDDAGSEVKHFQCPRYVGNNLDIASSFVRINYRNNNGEIDSYLVQELRVDGDNVLFDWVLTPKVTMYKGNVSFVMCVVGPDTKVKWHTTLGRGQVLEGLEPDNAMIENETADVVAALIAMVEKQTEAVADTGAEWVRNVQSEGTDQIIAVQTAGAEAKTDAVAEIEAKRKNSLESIPDDYTSLGNAVDSLVRGRAGAIVCEAEGTAIAVKDASDMAVQGLRVFGKTTQLTTTGKNLLNVSTENVLDVVGYTKYTIVQNVIHISGESLFAFKMPVARGNVYTFSLDKKATESTCHLRVYEYTYEPVSIGETDPNYIATPINSSCAGLTHVVKQYAPVADNVTWIAVGFYTNQPNVFTNFQAELGVDETEYEPYSGLKPSPSPEYPQELVSLKPVVSVTGKNLWGNGDVSITWSQSIDLTNPLQPGTYTLSLVATSTDTEDATCRIGIQDANEDGTMAYLWFGRDKREAQTITLHNVCTLFNFAASRASTAASGDTAVFSEIQMELGSVATEYEPYKPIQNLEVAQSLPGIPVTTGGNYTDSNGQQWVCDEVDLERGVYVHRLAKHELSSGLLFSSWTNGEKEIGVILRGLKWDYSPRTEPIALCSHFVPDVNGSIREGQLGFRLLGDYPYIYLLHTEGIAMTADEWRTFFDAQIAAGTPVTLVIKAESVTETPLSETEIAAYRDLHTYKPNTTIVNDSGAHMKVEYAADTKLYIDNKLAALVGNT